MQSTAKYRCVCVGTYICINQPGPLLPRGVRLPAPRLQQSCQTSDRHCSDGGKKASGAPRAVAHPWTMSWTPYRRSKCGLNLGKTRQTTLCSENMALLGHHIPKELVKARAANRQHATVRSVDVEEASQRSVQVLDLTPQWPPSTTATMPSASTWPTRLTSSTSKFSEPFHAMSVRPPHFFRALRLNLRGACQRGLVVQAHLCGVLVALP